MADFVEKLAESKSGLEAVALVTDVVTTADAYQDAAVVPDMLGFKSRTFVLSNAGANGLTYKVMASLGGAVYDVELVAEANLASGVTVVATENTKVITGLKVQVKSQVAGNPTTAVVKIGAMSA